MPEQVVAASPFRGSARFGRSASRSARPSAPRAVWIATVAGVVLVAVAWVILTRMRPAYDAFGWLVWGRQTLHLDLNTDGAPSWKPLTFLFTLPYALSGANPQMWLWMITSSAAALAGAVFAARIAFRLAGPCPQRPWAPWVAAAFAGFGILGINGYSRLVLIAVSDPMVMTLCLAAIDSHLSGRRRLTFALLVLISLGRPEGWPFAGLYAAWAWRAVPSMRPLTVAGIVLIPIAWFVVPALTSHSWFISGDLALDSQNVIHGNKIVGVLNRLRGLHDVPMQLAALFALSLTAVRRERTWMLLAAAAGLWVVIEIAFAYHGWPAVPRYLLEPAAVLVVLAASAVGRLLAYVPQRTDLLRWVPIAVVSVLIVAQLPAARSRARTAHGEIDTAHHSATQLSALQSVIRSAGGPARIKACGRTVTTLRYQSELAWALGSNVGTIGYVRPGSTRRRIPTVLFEPDGDGWQVRPLHLLAATASRCAGLRMDSGLGS